MKKKIFQQIYDNNIYTNFNKIYKIINNKYFFRNLIRRFYRYFYYYYKYNLNQTKRYAIYESFTFIIESLIFYYIIVANFILTLFKTINNINVIIIIIYKFLKKNIIIFDKNIYFAKN